MGNVLAKIRREAEAHEYFADNPDLRMTTGDHAARARNIRTIASDYEALLAERDALRKDAERYRWLRGGGIVELPYDDYGLGPVYPWHEDMDATIDVAMAATSAEPLPERQRGEG